MESWEALDLDDSDLPSLRPLKRQSQPVLRPHSSHSQFATVSSPNLPPLSPCPQHYNSSTPTKPRVPASTPRRLIPGPAGAIQAAMHRRDADGVDSFGDEEIRISTQEYMRRVEQDEGEDFGRNPWLLALKLATCHGMVDRTPLKAVKKRTNGDKIDKVVAIIKSCTANCLDGMMVTLKDPTDTIGAIIHHKVLTDGRFGKDMVVGSAMILQKVSVFIPSGASFYLNIVHGNVVKVISNELGSVELLAASAVKHFALGSGVKTDVRGQAPIMITERTENLIEEAGQDDTRSGNALTEKLTGEESSATRSCSVSSRLNQFAPVLDYGEGKQFERNNIPGTQILTDPADSVLEASSGSNNSKRSESLPRSIQSNRYGCDPNVVCKLDHPENFESVAVKNKKQAREEDNDLSRLIDVRPTEAMELPTLSRGNEFTVPISVKLDEQVAASSKGVGQHGPLLIFSDSFKQWTDEELGILDMDED